MSIRDQITTFFRGNKKLRPEGLEIEYTDEQVEEVVRCQEDIHYFIDKYVYTIHPDHGLVSMELRDYQTEIVDIFNENRFVIARWGRQMGKTASVAAVICHYILFNPGKTVAILGNKAANAKEVLRRVKIAYENLPIWLQRGVVNWNKGSIEIEGSKSVEGETRSTNTRVITGATSSDAIRGESISLLYIDEVAHIKKNLWEDFYDSVYPTISAGHTTKILLTSTPKGMNHFYTLCQRAKTGESNYIEHVARWDRVPDRDEEWKKRELKEMGAQKFAQEHEVAFIGSSLTLIDPKVLESIKSQIPISDEPHLKIFEEPVSERSYVVSADTSRGTSNDYSVATVYDVTEFPIRDVAMFRSNKISTVEFPGEIINLAKWYNNAHVLIELNDAGEEVANSVSMDHEYENILGYDAKSDRTSEKSHELGLWVSSRTKMLGCDRLKLLVNNGHFRIQAEEFVQEAWHFVENGRGSYAAEDGYHDDIMMTAVNFCYFFFSRSNLHSIIEDNTSLSNIINVGQLKRDSAAGNNVAVHGGVLNQAREADIELLRKKELRRKGIVSDEELSLKASKIHSRYLIGSLSDLSKEERDSFLK